MKDFAQKFTKLWSLVLDACDGMFSTAKFCLFLSKHRGFIGCEVDSSCVIEAILQLILLYARQVLI